MSEHWLDQALMDSAYRSDVRKCFNRQTHVMLCYENYKDEEKKKYLE